MDILNVLGNIVQFVINALVGIINALFGLITTLLPKSPFGVISNYVADIPFLGFLNYFIPIGVMLDILLLWASAMIVYFVGGIVLRWLKVIA